jgi:hypothetical protein
MGTLAVVFQFKVTGSIQRMSQWNSKHSQLGRLR